MLHIEKSLHGLDVILCPVPVKKVDSRQWKGISLFYGQVRGTTRYVNGILTSLIIEIRLCTKIFGFLVWDISLFKYQLIASLK